MGTRSNLGYHELNNCCAMCKHYYWRDTFDMPICKIMTDDNDEIRDYGICDAFKYVGEKE